MQYVNTGTSPNSGDGDSLRTAFNKINSNFKILSTASFAIPQGSGGYTGSQGNASTVPGPIGPIGYTGSFGTVGYTGSAGEFGYTGSAGEFGYTGSFGTVGYTGSAGEFGYTGSAGEFGYTGSAGTVDTGDLTIQFMSIIGTSTVEIVPFSEAIGADQYIVIDTFGANNINIRPGGFPNYSTATLSIGSISTNISTSDLDNSVYINTNDGLKGGGDSYQWKFNNLGELSLPLNGIIYSTGSLTTYWFKDPFQMNSATSFINLDSTGISLGVRADNQPNKIWSFLTSNGVLSTPGHIIPNTNNVYDLGSTSSQWRSLYVSTSTIYIGGKALSVTQAGDITVDGNTVSGGGTTLSNGTATLSISTLSETVLPSGLTFTPIENYGFGFGGTIAMQTYGEVLQMLATGTNAYGLFGWGETIGAPGGVAYLVGNQDGTNEVKIVAGSYTATVNTWKFDQNGSIILPAGNGNIKNTSGDVNIVADGFAQLQWTTPTGVAEADPNGTTQPKNWIYVESGGAYIETNISTSTNSRVWYFDNDGKLNLPGGGYAREVDDIYSPNSIVIRGRGGQDGVRLQWSNTVTTFSEVPIGESVFEEVILSDTGITLSVLVTDGNNPIPRSWEFKNDGSLVFPTLTVPISDNANPSGTGQTLKFNDPSQQAIIYGPPSDASYNSAQRVIIQGAPGYDGTIGEGGDIYLWAGPGGSAGGDGGDIKIRAGRGLDTGSGGYLNFQAGNAGVGVGANGGWINIESGQSALGVGGDITIHANSSGNIDIETVSTGTIRLSTANGTKIWTFNEVGALAVPGFIYNNDSSNVGQLLLAGDAGEASSYLALPSDIASTTTEVRLANSLGDVRLIAGNNKNWYFNTTGGLELPGGSVLATYGYDVALVAGNNASSSTFGSVTINTQGPPAVYTVVQQSSPIGVDAVYTSDILTPNYASIVPGMTVTGSGITALTTVTSVTGPDGFGTITINVSTTPGTQLPYLETYTFTAPGGVTDRNWEFNSLGELNLPQGGAIQETQVTNELWGTTTTSLTLVPGGAANGTQRLEIYSTGGGEGNHIHITSGDQTQTDLFLGNDTQYFAVAANGQNYIQARNGYASPSPGISAGPGANVNIYGGNAGDNGGNAADGNSGGDVFIASGISTSGLGGDILLNTSSGPDGFGSIELSTDGGSSYWSFDKDKTLTFPSGGGIVFDSSATSTITGVSHVIFSDGTTQTTAYPGYLTWSISANGASSYVFSGPGIETGNTENPVLYLYKGFTYKFINTTGGSHPFAIRVSNGGADYTSGVSGSQTGTQTFTVPMNAPSTLYYQCTFHSGMGNVINIV